MNNMRYLFCLLSYICLGNGVTQAGSECTHHIVAVLALEQLDKERQDDVIKTLMSHPRWAQDFQPEDRKLSEKELMRWIVGRAGYWPHSVPIDSEFARPSWHYQAGSTLDLGVGTVEPVVELPEKVDLSTKDLQLSQAIEVCRQTLRSTSKKADKAIVLCWLMNLVADAHHPCNCGSLYVPGVFPKGDDWAKRIMTTSNTNLHLVWDSQLGNAYAAETIRTGVVDLEDEVLNAKQYNRDNDVQSAWISESRAIARVHVYTPRVLAVVEASDGESPVVVELSPEYLRNARKMMQMRSGYAAYRLARILQSDLKP